ncbi:MAG: hypothetical protein KAS72_08345 [Phycisphaerales bacterium]|nr:hypothetical protein [Phycisphaerales bacterium]
MATQHRRSFTVGRIPASFGALLVLAASALLPACAPARDAGDTTTRTTALFELYIGSETADDFCTVKRTMPASMLVLGDTIYLAEKPLLSTRHIHRASRRTSEPSRPGVLLALTETGASILKDSADLYINRQVVFVFDGRILSAPYAMSALGSGMPISTSPDGLREDEVDDLIDRLNAAVADVAPHGS